MTTPDRFSLLLFSCLFLGFSGMALAVDGPEKPHQIVGELRQRMYAIGETTGRFDDFIAAEKMAAAKMRDHVVNGDPSALVEKNDTGQTPLMAAAFMGYAELVSELLKSEKVRSTLDDANPKGLNAWLYANIGFRQTMWVCNPNVFNAPFTFVPLFVTQPYYRQSLENPYIKTRRLLEEAGAKTDQEQAKQFWLDTCRLQDEKTRSRVRNTNDLLETLLAESDEMLARFIAEQQSKGR